MSNMDDDILSLKKQLLEKDAEIAALKNKLQQIHKDNSLLMDLQDQVSHLAQLQYTSLTNDDILRYSRQLLLPELGVKGQMSLLNTSVLVVGCGGLGCPLALYLAAAGIGRLGLLDYDEVELSNLHRQVLHTERTQGLPKAQSAAQALSRLNSTTQCVPYHLQLSSENALQLIQQYDIVADCSDNVPTRYLVNDACVLSGKPLVSASALRMEGQLTVYNYNGGPCYRCLYPVPPPPETVTNCSDGGVLGVVVGVMGCLQALEVLKIASGQKSSFGQQLLMFDAQDGRFRCIKLRAKQAGCVVCGEMPTVTELQDYESFCGSSATDKCRRLNLLSAEQRVSVQEYKSIVDCGIPHLLLDVRPKVEVDICHLPVSINIPLASLEDQKGDHIHFLKEKINELKLQMSSDLEVPVYVVCKLGNDSQTAVQLLEKMSGTELENITVKDITGGLMAWANKIDPSFPKY
ncbi:adenylyltransferase and sulfurtransferase MOCS3 [Ictalurus punctatus]|uniref:Adenylyltransferase and sulfurtransferase MOCS3 n=1 Tax=Ictalurus punctatus TaxID=7998 RepID=E3TE18_ICTPU|nr:adenylyltransferase and sulfurtransferase MOCS3 [Ictalurus punctatus]ADO28554.1 adenylyltransferase and sulfurtransferase mocs3 [Ictalurus punctatus]